jgi:hypothetical protein
MKRRVARTTFAAGIAVASVVGFAGPAWAPKITFGPTHDLGDCRGTGWREMGYWGVAPCLTNAQDAPEWLYRFADSWNRRLPAGSPYLL